jgi:hypothetical protein
MAIKPAKPFVFPKVKPNKVAPMAVPPPNPEQAILKQFVTKPAARPLGKAAIRGITKPLKSYLP